MSKKEIIDEINKLRIENSKLKTNNIELLKIMRDLNKDVNTLLEFAEAINSQLDYHKIIELAKLILQDAYSHKILVYVDEQISDGWIDFQDIDEIDYIRKLMYAGELIFVEKTLDPNSLLGEHRINLKDGLNNGIQSLYASQFRDELSKALSSDDKEVLSRHFHAILEQVKNKFQRIDFKSSLYLDIYSSFRKNEALHNFFKNSAEKIKRDINEKMIYFYKNNIMSFVAIPLRSNDMTVGYIQISVPFERHSIIKEQIQFLKAFANLIVVALVKAKQYRKDIYYDQRTGLPNKILLFKHLDNYLKQGRKFSILFTDLDYFKNYVDIFGHEMAQKVVDDFGLLMRSQLTENCLVSNYAGDEYMVLIPDKTKNEALEDAETIRKNTENFLFDGENEHISKKVRVCIGISDSGDVDENVDLVKQKLNLIKKADDAMFFAKNTGRNKVCLWTQEIPVKRLIGGDRD